MKKALHSLVIAIVACSVFAGAAFAEKVVTAGYEASPFASCEQACYEQRNRCLKKHDEMYCGPIYDRCKDKCYRRHLQDNHQNQLIKTGFGRKLRKWRRKLRCRAIKTVCHARYVAKQATCMKKKNVSGCLKQAKDELNRCKRGC
tara:strand:+ start:2736 stop:3170 length:435 start_codon:yes stop_codon:yes gene_type:complete